MSGRPPPSEPLALHFERGRSLLSELRRRGEAGPDFPERIPAVAVDPARDVPLEVAQEHRLDGRPLLWLRPGEGAVIDERAAGELACVLATRLTPGAEQALGRFTPRARAALGGRGLLLFLLQAGVIQTWAHLEARLTLTAEREDAAAWEGELEGVHVYYTQRRHEARLAFRVRIGADGAVSVRGS